MTLIFKLPRDAMHKSSTSRRPLSFVYQHSYSTLKWLQILLVPFLGQVAPSF